MSFESELCLLGQKRNIADLQELVRNTAKETILGQIPKLIHKDNFIIFWDYLLQGFDNSHESHAKRFQVCQKVLSELENQSIPSFRCSAIIINFVIELKKFIVDHVLFFSKYCVEQIQKAKSTCTIWKEIFPAVLKTLENIESFDYNGEETTGLEYKQTIIRALCILEWNPNIIVPLTIMFTEISLNNDQHQTVVKKLCFVMENLMPPEIPAFIYQLLSLCKNRNSEIAFLKLQQYFGRRIYNINFAENSESMDLISNAAEADVIQSESTVLFHIHSAATRNSVAILQYLSKLKHLTRVPEYILYPSHLTILLTIASVDRCELSVIRTVIQAIDSSLTEREHRYESHWYREQVTTDINHEQILKQIIVCSQEARDMLLQGLVHLSFNLLAVKKCPATRHIVVENKWNLGSFILVRLIKQKRHMASSILRTLTNHIMKNRNGVDCISYIDCLYLICNKFGLDVLKSRNCIIDLMETALLSTEFISNQILESILPLTKASQSLRDEVVLSLKKALFSRKLDTRKIAVNGFLKLLRYVRVTDLNSLSQLSNSSGSASSSLSVFTQLSLARYGHSSGSSATRNTATGNVSSKCVGAFSNEALCWEILGTLRCCFNLQSDVKIQLYDGLYDTICANNILGVPIMDVIFAHFNSYCVWSDDILPPIKINKIAKVQENEVILIEPLGKFIYIIGLIIHKIRDSENDFEGLQKFVDILENLCQRMSRCELIHFELDDGTDLSDFLPECELKVLILKEMLQIYEALIGYQICIWKIESKNNSNTILNLFQGYNRLLQFSKDCIKPKKIRKKDKDETTSNETSKKELGSKWRAIKLPNSILDLKSTGKLLNLLLRPQVDWSNLSQADILKNKSEIHQYTLQATLNIIQSVKTSKDAEFKPMESFYGHCTNISATLYEKCVVKYRDYVDFDEKSANLALELFYLMLEQICMNYRQKLIHFLHIIAGKSMDQDLEIHLKVLIDVYIKLFIVDEDDQTDSETGKALLTVINTIKLLAKQLPVQSTPLSIQLMNWTKAFLSEKTMKYRNCVTVFINLTFALQIKHKSGVALFKNISLRLGNIYGTIDEEKEAVDDLKLVNELTADIILTELHVIVKQYLQDVDFLLARLKSEHYLVIRVGDEKNTINRLDNLKRKERGLCCQLCLIIDLISTLINLKIQLGGISEAVMKNLAHVFTTLCSTTQYFLTRSSAANPNTAIQHSRFESVIQKAGKQLSPLVYNLLTYLEESENGENVNQSTQSKKKKAETLKKKVWKDRKRFPQVVYGMERFSSSVSQLTTRSKLNLSKYIGQGTTRDFRIKADALKEIPKTDDTINTTATSTQTSDSSMTADNTIDMSNNDVTKDKDDVY